MQELINFIKANWEGLVTVVTSLSIGGFSFHTLIKNLTVNKNVKNIEQALRDIDVTNFDVKELAKKVVPEIKELTNDFKTQFDKVKEDMVKEIKELKERQTVEFNLTIKELLDQVKSSDFATAEKMKRLDSHIKKLKLEEGESDVSDI